MSVKDGLEEKEQPGMSTQEIARVVREVLKENEKTKEGQINHQELVNEVKGLKGMICDPVTGRCWLPTKADLAGIKESIPNILGGHADLSGLFRSLARGGNDHRQDEAVQARIPPELKVRWLKEWCKDGQCKTLLENDPDIKITDTGQRRPGLLGT